MQPPISPGTVLQNRYRLLNVLGQGGFGRTYLAEDLGRFNERCALKEFIPVQTGAYALDKAKELFQREANILYQIQHPQVPQFRATFEENQRLFLVQDYVDGKTYRALLNERKAKGQVFSEGEILRLIQQLLPVLAHIHSKGIIHRDISPDNIMLRQQDNLPVLIDFGVVKEIVTRVQAPDTVTQATTVGKLGYAPSEQMQTGRAYPNSDLYALAVSAVVLLTGREPSELYDDVNLNWYWQRYASVNPGFAQILNKMMSYRPGDRYQSAAEVSQALQALINPAASPPVAAANPPANPPGADLSQMQTLAVGHRPEPAPAPPAAPINRPNQADPIIPIASEQSVWDNPWAVIGIGVGLAIVTGIGASAVVSAFLNASSRTPTPTITTTVTLTPTPTPTATPSATPTPQQPVDFSQRLNLAAGSNTSAQGGLQSNQTVTYVVAAEQGQTLTAALQSEGVLMTVLGPNGELVNDQAKRITNWQGALPFTGDYYIKLSPVKGVNNSNYQLNLSLAAAPQPTPTPSATPSASPSPQVNSQRLEIPAGQTETTVSGRVDNNQAQRYLVNAQAGQVLSAELTQGAATLNIYSPNGKLVEDASGIVSWQAKLPDSGDYIIEVVSAQPVDFNLRVQINNSQ